MKKEVIDMAFSFSAIEILPSLLNKTKCQTIRPLPKNGIPRTKVGSVHKLFWKQRSKYPLFCRKCGNQIHTRIHNCLFPLNETKLAFPKLLGTGTITEVFEIEMWVGNDAPLIKGYRLQDTYELARRDGFLPGDDGKYRGFYDYFMRYDLSTPKRFVVYRWEWD